MINDKRNELIKFVGEIYEASKTDLTTLLADMQPKEHANINEVNDLVERVRQNIVALRNASMLCLDVNKNKIACKGELILSLKSKQDWINRIPDELPEKRLAETRLFLDKNGNVLARGKDFEVAEIEGTYPVNVYSLQSVYESIK